MKARVSYSWTARAHSATLLPSSISYPLPSTRPAPQTKRTHSGGSQHQTLDPRDTHTFYTGAHSSRNVDHQNLSTPRSSSGFNLPALFSTSHPMTLPYHITMHSIPITLACRPPLCLREAHKFYIRLGRDPVDRPLPESLPSTCSPSALPSGSGGSRRRGRRQSLRQPPRSPGHPAPTLWDIGLPYTAGTVIESTGTQCGGEPVSVRLAGR